MIELNSLDANTKIALMRSAILFGPVWIVYALVVLRPLKKAELTGILLAFMWCFFSLILVNVLMVNWGWWSFEVKGGTFWGTPVDLILGWALLWSVLPSLKFSQNNLLYWFFILFALDLATMPLLEPVLKLSDKWVWGELLCLVLVYLPSRILAEDTRKHTHLHRRCILQMLLYGMIFFGILPILVLGELGDYDRLLESAPTLFLFAQVYCVIALIGASALQELDIRGGGTPFPLDPTKRLVTTGPYAYVANPMQFCQGMLFVSLSIFFNTVFIVGMGVIFIFYLGFTRLNERGDHLKNFGEPWKVYREHVRDWLPHFFPWHENKAQLFVDLSGCGACAWTGTMLQKLKLRQLEIIDAKFYPGDEIMRMTYRDGDGYEETGISALGRAFEHVNIVWAMVGFALRLPVISHVLQWWVDFKVPPHSVPLEKNEGALPKPTI